jgi:hypothetical protein
MLGRFLEISLPAPKILESWQFYLQLGFTAAVTGETWPHRYTVLTDGRVAIGLHDAPLPGATLAFVRPDLARHIGALEAAGIEFDHRVLGDESFNEASFTTPGGHEARLLEARTFSSPKDPPPSLLGWFEEYALGVDDLALARDYWERLGFVAAATAEEPWPYVGLTSDTVNVGLHLTRALSQPSLVFSAEDIRGVRERLATLGIEPTQRLPRALDPATHLLITAPEGTQLLIGPPPV